MKFIPLSSLAEAIDRQRLIDQALNGPPGAAGSTIITAPAGYGKTTLLAQIKQRLEPQHFRTAWLNCSSDHIQPSSFLVDLAASLQHAGLFRKKTEFGLTDIISSLIDHGPVAIFIDEYECATSDDTDNLLELFIRLLPQNCKLFIATRELPKISLSKLLVDARTRLVKANELRFNEAETQSLLSDIPHTDRHFTDLYGQCDGWPVILQLLRLEGQHSEKSEMSSETFSHRGSIFNYMAEQILARQESAVQNFLLHISVLPEVEVGAARHVTEHADAERLLHAVLKLSPIVTMTGEMPLSLRLHPLFRDFLSQELALRAPLLPNRLHSRAAEYYAAVEELHKAVHHASLSGDNELTARILENAGGALLVISEGIAGAGALLAALPPSFVNSRPRLRQLRAIQQAMEGTSSDWLGDFERLAYLHNTVPVDIYDDEFGLIMDLVKAVRNCSETRFAVTSAPWEEMARLREKCLSRRYEEPRYMGIYLPAEQILTCDYGSITLAERRTQEMQTLFETEKYAPNTVWVTNHLAFIAAIKGHPLDAERYSQIVLERVTDTGETRNTLMRQHCNAILGNSYYEQNASDLALAHFDTVPRHIAYSLLSTEYYAICTRARCVAQKSGIAAALADLHEDYQYALEEALPHLSVLIPAVIAELQLTGGDLSGCELIVRSAGLDELLDQHRNWYVRPWMETEALVRLFSRYWVSKGEMEKAYNLAHEFAVRASQSGRVLMGACGFLDAADAALAAGYRSKALAVVQQAMKLSEGTGAIRHILDASGAVQSLIREITRDEREAVALFHSDASPEIQQSQLNGDSRKTLSPRERDVMSELCLGNPTKIAARNLKLSHETVRHHLKKIYSKLNVHTKNQAVKAWLSENKN